MMRLVTFLFFVTTLGACTSGPGKGSLNSSSGVKEPPVGMAFSVGRKAVQLLPFTMRMSKLKYVVQSDDANLYKILEERKSELGAYDYAQGVGQELSWLETRMTLWTKGVQPICSSDHMRTKYSWPVGARNFIMAAYGREPSNSDNELINRVNGAGATDADKLEIFCLAVLSSLEFLTL